MSKAYVLYNPLSGNGCGQIILDAIKDFVGKRESTYLDITEIEDYSTLLHMLVPGDQVVVCGGDGTLNRFVNNVYDMNLANDIYYYPTGSGNDFLRDIGVNVQDGPVRINDYIRDLPCVEVNGKTYRFLNGVGYGLDGYCCEIGERLRTEGKKPNYTSIAIKSLLFHYKSTNASVCVDGKEQTYRRVWIAPTMHGRYYGGGMMAAPAQVRNNEAGTLTVTLVHNGSNFKILYVLPSIFEGKHIRFANNVAQYEGHDITVKFDRPVTLQIDGEIIKNVTQYRAYNNKILDT